MIWLKEWLDKYPEETQMTDTAPAELVTEEMIRAACDAYDNDGNGWAPSEPDGMRAALRAVAPMIAADDLIDELSAALETARSLAMSQIVYWAQRGEPLPEDHFIRRDLRAFEAALAKARVRVR